MKFNQINLNDFLKFNNFNSFSKINEYGFDFDSQIGGLKQINKINDNLVEFF